MAADPDVMLKQMQEDRQILQCIRSQGTAWRVVWLEGRRRATSIVASAPLCRLVEKKRANLDTLYEPGSEQQLLAMRDWASLAWLLWVVEEAEAAEG